MSQRVAPAPRAGHRILDAESSAAPTGPSAGRARLRLPALLAPARPRRRAPHGLALISGPAVRRRTPRRRRSPWISSRRALALVNWAASPPAALPARSHRCAARRAHSATVTLAPGVQRVGAHRQGEQERVLRLQVPQVVDPQHPEQRVGALRRPRRGARGPPRQVVEVAARVQLLGEVRHRPEEVA